jgi:hypothetical protein
MFIGRTCVLIESEPRVIAATMLYRGSDYGSAGIGLAVLETQT